MAIEQDGQISVKVPGKIVDDADEVLKSEAFQNDPQFEYARKSVSLVYRVALREGLKVLTQRYLGQPPARRKADQFVTDTPSKPPTPKPKPTSSSTRKDTMTGAELHELTERLKDDHGIRQLDICELVPISQPNFTALKRKVRLTEKMDGKVRAAIEQLVPDFDWGDE